MKLVHFYQKITVKTPSGGKFSIISTDKAPYHLLIEHTNTFASSGTAGTVEFTLHNLRDSHEKYFKKDAEITFVAGWTNADATAKIIHKVIEGPITTVTPPSNSDGDTALHFALTANKQYDSAKAIKVKKSRRVRVRASQKDLDKAISTYNSKINKQRRTWIDEHPHASKKEVTAKNKHFSTLKKNYATNARSAYNKKRKELDNSKKYQVKTTYEYLSFKAGTKGSTIIKKIAKMAGIKLKSVKLAYDRPYPKGYTAKSKPMKCIEQIAADCETDIIYRYDGIHIEKLDTHRKINLYIQDTTGLLQRPEYQDDDGGNKWQVMFLYRAVSVGDVFHLKSPDSTGPTGWVIILSGNSSYQSGSSPTTQVVVQLYSSYKKTITKKINAKKKADRTTKAKLDAKEKAAAKKKAKSRRKKVGGKK